MSWWKHFECEVPKLAELGVTQIWLPPPNKATSNVCTLSTCPLGINFILSPERTGLRFHQKGTTSTRWGSKDELLEAISVAKQHGIDVLIDAVLNVRSRFVRYILSAQVLPALKHKLGADRTETFDVIPVDNANRLKEVGPVRQIEVTTCCVEVFTIR